LLGSLILALFWRRVGPRAAMCGMIASVVVMCAIYWPANLPLTREWWLRTFGGEIFWPWFTLIGTCVTLGVAWLVRAVWPQSPAALAAAAPAAAQPSTVPRH
jgi:Na+/proline symporter